MGWKQRDWYLSPEVAALVFDRNGNGGPTIWVDGRIVGGWVQRKDGTVATKLLTDPGRDVTTAIAERVAMLEALLGDTRFTVRFPRADAGLPTRRLTPIRFSVSTMSTPGGPDWESVNLGCRAVNPG